MHTCSSRTTTSSSATSSISWRCVGGGAAAAMAVAAGPSPVRRGRTTGRRILGPWCSSAAPAALTQAVAGRPLRLLRGRMLRRPGAEVRGAQRCVGSPLQGRHSMGRAQHVQLSTLAAGHGVLRRASAASAPPTARSPAGDRARRAGGVRLRRREHAYSPLPARLLRRSCVEQGVRAGRALPAAQGPLLQHAPRASPACHPWVLREAQGSSQ